MKARWREVLKLVSVCNLKRAVNKSRTCLNYN